MPDAVNDAKPYIFFELAGTTYAVESYVIQQMEMVDHVTPVPDAPAFVDGVVFARGQVVPVVNLRARFGFPRVANDAKTRLMVVSHEGRTVGLLVDAAHEFVMVPSSTVQPPPEAVTELGGKYLAGIATLGKRVVLILKVGELLDFQDQHSNTNVHG